MNIAMLSFRFRCSLHARARINHNGRCCCKTTCRHHHNILSSSFLYIYNECAPTWCISTHRSAVISVICTIINTARVHQLNRKKWMHMRIKNSPTTTMKTARARAKHILNWNQVNESRGITNFFLRKRVVQKCLNKVLIKYIENGLFDYNSCERLNIAFIEWEIIKQQLVDMQTLQ